MNADAYKYIRFNASQETRWATVEEMRRSCAHIRLDDEDYPAAGLPIMSDAHEAYVDNTDTHSLIFGATGSKKTRLFCMPMINMMAKAGESFVVTDPKGELYNQTSGLVKEKGYKTVVLNFRDIGTGDMWNPLSIPYELWLNGYKDEAGFLLSDVAATLAAPVSNNPKDAYWVEAAQELALANFYLLFEAGKREEVNMKSFARLSSQGSVEELTEISKMMREDSVAGINYSSTVGLKAAVTASGIVGTLFGMLRVFLVNNKLGQMLAGNTFNMRKIGREKTAVYIIVPDEKTSYHFLITMFVKQVYEILIGEAQKEKNRTLPVRVNFVLDEFCNIPKIPDMPSMISAARSRNIRYFLVVQSMHQLKGRYGEDADTIKGNCDNWVFLTSKELDLLTEISELCGNIITPEGQQRRLISTSELQRFDKMKGEALIMHCRQYPIISEMPDISDYKMFGIYDAVPILPRDTDELKCFSLKGLMDKIRRYEAVAPFASEAHKFSAALHIYKDELRLLGAEDSVLEEAVRSARRSGFSLRPTAESPKTNKERLKEAREKAFARISAVIDKEYAEEFFKQDLAKAIADNPGSFDPYDF